MSHCWFILKVIVILKIKFRSNYKTEELFTGHTEKS